MTQTRPRFLVTAGPTREYIDPVRFITNAGSGKMGCAVADAAHAAGCSATLITGPVHVSPREGVSVTHVETTQDMCDAVTSLLSSHDILVMTASPCDFTPMHRASHKMKKGGRNAISIECTRTPDILSHVSDIKTTQIIIGFAAETEDICANAEKKLKSKKLDMIIANDVSTSRAGFAVPHIIATALYLDGQKKEYGHCSKVELATDIVDDAIELYVLRRQV